MPKSQPKKSKKLHITRHSEINFQLYVFLKKMHFFWPELTVPKEQRVQRDKAAHCTVGKP